MANPTIIKLAQDINNTAELSTLTKAQVVGWMRTNIEKVVPGKISNGDFLEAIPIPERESLNTPAQMDNFRLLMSISEIDLSAGTNAKALFDSLFSPASQTVANISSRFLVSRTNKAWGGFEYESERQVEQAIDYAIQYLGRPDNG